MKKKLRTISLIMFIIAIVFVACAFSAPNLGRTIYIGSYEFGVQQWHFCYVVYAVVMMVLFATSFFVKEKEQ